MTKPVAPDFSEGNYLPEQFDLPSDPKETNQKIKEIFESHARLLNRKDTGQYETVEIQTNQTWPGATPQHKRYIYRKIIDTGALANTGTTNIVHGLVGIDNNWFFTRIYGTAIEPAGAGLRPYFISLPNSGPTYQVEIMVDTTNVNITTIANLSAFTSSFVVLEFYKA